MEDTATSCLCSLCAWSCDYHVIQCVGVSQDSLLEFGTKEEILNGLLTAIESQVRCLVSLFLDIIC